MGIAALILSTREPRLREANKFVQGHTARKRQNYDQMPDLSSLKSVFFWDPRFHHAFSFFLKRQVWARNSQKESRWKVHSSLPCQGTSTTKIVLLLLIISFKGMMAWVPGNKLDQTG